MVETLREWVTAVVAAAVLVAAAERLTPKGTIRKIASFIGGLVLLLVLLRPVTELRPGRVELERRSYETAIARKTEELRRENSEALAQGIAREAEAYISDKAEALGCSGEIRVSTRDTAEDLPLPWSVELTGRYSAELSEWMERELDIPAERQVWYEQEG